MMTTPRTGAIVVPEGESVQQLLMDFAETVKASGLVVGGLVQRTLRDEAGVMTDMQLLALDNGETLPIDQKLGRNAVCAIDTQAMAAASMAVRRAVAARSDLVVVNKYSHLEAKGGGLADEAMLAMSEEIPLLIAVGTKYLGAWMTFSGGLCALLEAKPAAVQAWWDALRAEIAAQP